MLRERNWRRKWELIPWVCLQYIFLCDILILKEEAVIMATSPVGRYQRWYGWNRTRHKKKKQPLLTLSD